MHHTRLYYLHFFFFDLMWRQIMSENCAGRDSPHHSAALTPSNNKSNLHFSASLSVMEWKYSKKKKKYSRGATDVLGDRSQRRGAVANFMPCIFLSCMADSRFGPARWNARPVIFHSIPPPSSSSSSCLGLQWWSSSSIFMWEGLAKSILRFAFIQR